jgi:excisionase family DNA binding protein
MHPKTIVSMVERGELRAYKVGRYWRYRKSDIEAYLEARQNIPTSEEPKQVEAHEHSETAE